MRSVRATGLSRCCLTSIDRDQDDVYDLRTLDCDHCGEVMIYLDGAWEQLVSPFAPKSAVRRRQ